MNNFNSRVKKQQIAVLFVFVCIIFSSCFHAPDYYDPIPVELQTKWYNSEADAIIQGNNWVYNFTGEHELLWNLDSYISKEDAAIRQKDRCLIYRDVGTGAWIILWKKYQITENRLDVINLFDKSEILYKN
ncbi:MAG: hypothetical protein LBV69_11895 [Bacteroidales bacterium]|jgi:hypothetical protein|nr:hypothetical protein [Bacteroidales bacterium]